MTEDGEILRKYALTIINNFDIEEISGDNHFNFRGLAIDRIFS